MWILDLVEWSTILHSKSWMLRNEEMSIAETNVFYLGRAAAYGPPSRIFFIVCIQYNDVVNETCWTINQDGKQVTQEFYYHRFASALR